MSTKLQKKQFLKEIAPTITVGSFFIIVLAAIAVIVAVTTTITAWVPFVTAVIVNVVIFAAMAYFVVEAYQRHKIYTGMRMY